MRILVVDDDAMAAELAGAVIEEMGHEAVLAGDAGEARARLEDGPGFDAIVSDMHMPDESGLDLFGWLGRAGRAVPFILLTGDDPEAFRQREPGLAACLLKDFTLEETLPQVLGAVLGGRDGS
ncbi:MAG: response regulator [Solidesulfovibrio sp. DCME]|uniref:response regulator n=1 Tax=Solidesulfovibrio sp. DCME TaxID=3447380 RepID=UPI003D0D5A71